MSEPATHTHEEAHHASVHTYVMVAVILTLITAMEFAVIYIRQLTPILVPLLLGFATVLFAYAGRISAFLRARAGDQDKSPHRWEHSIGVILPVSFYGGYFGAGVGVLMLGIFSVGTRGDYRSANVSKNLVTALNSATATAIFAVQGVISWPATLLLMAGTLLGAMIGARLAQVMPNRAARSLVVVVGALLTAVFAWRYWA